MTRPKKPPKPKKEVNNQGPEILGNPEVDINGDTIEESSSDTSDVSDDPGDGDLTAFEDNDIYYHDPEIEFPDFNDVVIDQEPPPLPAPPPLPETKETNNVIEYHPDRSYFFIFGQGASGKTVLISSILYYLYTIRSGEYRDTLKNLNNSDLKHEQEGNKLWKELNQTIFTKKFPRGTTTVQNQNPIPRHISAHFTPSSNSPEFKFCLMDMAGEDLEKIDYESNQSLPSSISTYIEELPKANMCFIYVLNPDDQYFSNEKKLGLFQAFINTLDANEHTNTPLLLLVTKWDTIKDKYVNAEDFVKKEFSPIWGTLNQNERKITIGKFSIGEVIGDNPTATNFENFDPKYPQSVFEWMYKTQVGESLNNNFQKEKSFFQKILDIFK